MITPAKLRAKASRMFTKIVSSALRGENNFPLVITGNKQVSGNNFSDWKKDIVPMHDQSKAVKGKGYAIDWKDKIINGSKQSVPSKIYFDTLEDFLHFIKKEKEYQHICLAKEIIVSNFPSLEQWANDNPTLLLENHTAWKELVEVCRYFTTHEPPHPYYLRELPIVVHTKFIEANSSLLKRLLDRLLPPEKKNTGSNDFSERYFIKKISIYTQIRILDDALKPHLGYDECSLALEDAAWLNWVPENVFIIENQACFLSFPKLKNSVAIFGEGFKSRLSKHIPWLSKTKLYCWFDLDTAGFEMLNMIRQHYPNAINFLMEEDTFIAHQNFSVDNKARKKELALLTSDEKNLYNYLVLNTKRLEQERIPQQYIKMKLELATTKNGF